jgi:probable DNA metabolism protein
MNSLKIFVCGNSMDEIFTAIYDAWASRYGHGNIKLVEEENLETLELFADYIKIERDFEKAIKVADSIQKKISEEAYSLVCRCALSKMKGRADVIYRFLIQGFSVGSRITENLSNPVVHPLFTASRKVNNEAGHFLEFVRFSELKNKILFSKIRPENNILTLIAPHFSERLADENWMILDVGRETAIIHKAGCEWFLTDATDMNLEFIEDYSENEWQMQILWQKFVDTIAIKERMNLKLQKQLLPNRYREFMREVTYKV